MRLVVELGCFTGIPTPHRDAVYALVDLQKAAYAATRFAPPEGNRLGAPIAVAWSNAFAALAEIALSGLFPFSFMKTSGRDPRQNHLYAIMRAKLAFDNLMTAQTKEERRKARLWMLAWTKTANVHLLGNDLVRTR
jgi:hypothetical protein